MTNAKVTGLKNLETYVFTVTPTDGSWEGKASEPVTATPQPASVPGKVDMVNVTVMDAALGVSWKKAESATYYELYYQVWWRATTWARVPAPLSMRGRPRR